MDLKTRLVDTQEATTKYPPLAEVRKTLKVKWYRCEMDPAKFNEFIKASDSQGCFQAGGHLALYVCTGFLVYISWAHALWTCLALALFAHGTVGSCFLFGAHELAHGTVFRTKCLNKAFLYLFSLLSWWDPFDYAMSHTFHHRYTQFPEADRENLFPLDPSISPFTILQLFTVALTFQPGRVFGKGGLLSHIYLFVRAACDLPPGSVDVVSHEWLIAIHKEFPEELQKVVQWSRLMLLFHGAVVALTIYTRVWVLPLIVSFGTFLANWLRFVMGSTQHCGLMSNAPDFRKSTRSIELNPLLEFLYWRMNWHIEHHMFAQVPCYNLKALHHEVAQDMPKPRTLIGAWGEMWETYERQKTDPSYEFDTPLPACLGQSPGDARETLEVSIGDLAPASFQ